MTENTKAFASKDEVEFRTPADHGDVVVRVFFGGRTPRVMCTFNVGTSQHPISMHLHEIHHFVQEAEVLRRELETKSS